MKIKKMLKPLVFIMVGAVTVSAVRAQEDTKDGFNWVWSGLTDSTWSGNNWNAELGSVTGAAWLNLAPINTPFSGVVNKTDSPIEKDGTLTVDPSVPLQVGYVLAGGNFHWNRATIFGVQGDGVYDVNRLNGGGNSDNLRAFTGINAIFENVSDTITVNGVQYVNQFRVRGNGNIVFANVSGGKIQFNPLHDDGGNFTMENDSNVTFSGVNISNEAGASDRLNFRNNSNSGTLSFINNTLYGSDGFHFEQNLGNTTAFDNVTFDSPGNRSIELTRGVFNFSGNITASGGEFAIGQDGNTVVTIADGAVFNGRSINIGDINANNASLIIKGSALVELTEKLRVGNGNTNGYARVGNAEIRDTAAVTVNDLVIGDNSASADSKLTVAGGTLTVKNDFSVRGVMEISGSGSVIRSDGGEIKIGDWGQGGSLTIKDNGALLASGKELKVGHDGPSTMTVSGGRVELGDFKVGHDKDGVLNVSGGYISTTSGQHLYINSNRPQDTTGIVNISGGTLATNGVIFGKNGTVDGSSGTSQLNISGGVLQIYGSNGIHTGSWGEVGEWDPTHTAASTELNLGGGTIKAGGSWELKMPATLTGSNGRIKFDTNGTLTVSGALTGAGGLEVAGGTLFINSANDYEGGSVVSGYDAFLKTGANGTLGLGDVIVGADAALLFGNNLSMDLGASLSFYYDEAAAGSRSLIMLDYDGTMVIKSLFNSYTGEYIAAGTHSASELNDLFGGVSIFSDGGWLNVLEIPEPSTLMLFVAGAALLVGLRKRR